MADSWLDALGVTPVINAAGPVTRLGGQRMRREVVAAMAEAAGAHLPIDALQRRAGEIIAELTGAESGYVTAGAAAGVVLSAAAAIAGDDVDRMSRLPDSQGRPNEIVVQHQHDNDYLRLVRLSGARLVSVGSAGYPGAGGTRPWQIEAAITAQTCAVAVAAGDHPGEVELPTVADIAHRHNLPVIVDAAAALPPVSRLRELISAGADLVVFSAGKAIGGPQGAGILCGRADLIRSVALQHQDMDVQPETWLHGPLVAEGVVAGPPVHGIGRPMKVGKETIVGALVALKTFADADHAKELAAQQATLQRVMATLQTMSGVVLTLDTPSGRTPRLHLDFGDRARAAAVAVQLREHRPPIHTREDMLDVGRLTVLASTLAADEAVLVAEALRRAG
jgi:L-seryl-tRNA(Ser) seleniumtransferase